ncbi:MAG: CPP1-like family protein [Synechococcus sp.]|nr:CPP1-like family protein [Synechococcus sp.]
MLALVAQAPSPADPNSNDPYERLGIRPDASFEAVQQAKQARLEELPADDATARARVEAAYDAVLMQRLKDRQLGQLTGAAATASQVEASAGAANPAAKLPKLPALSALPSPKLDLNWPELSLAEGPMLWQPLLGHGLVLTALLLLGSQPGLPELLLSLAALITIASLQRRRQRFFRAVGFTLLALIGGSLISGLLATALAGLSLPLAASQLAAIPTLLLLAALAVLLA